MVNPTQKNRLKTLIYKGLRFYESLTRLLTRLGGLSGLLTTKLFTI